MLHGFEFRRAGFFLPWLGRAFAFECGSAVEVAYLPGAV